MKGKVVWFNIKRGFGFIKPDDGSKDLYFHYSQVLTEGKKVLKENDEVEYQTEEGPKGLQATNIKLV